ncbi:DNA-binding transcriptional regulator, PadR family [Prauserella aidingensis]|nr:DNA-binding transcriptional regulator, PadR family [Prauserella aidingensis]
MLGLMLRRALSLYELHGRFEAGLAHIYAASYGSIHRALRQLHDAGDVEQIADPDPPRNTKRYVTTDQGRRNWLDWMKHPRSAEDSEASMLARVFLLGLLESSAERRDVLIALRERALRDVEALRTVDATAGTEDVESAVPHYPRAALDYGVQASEAIVTWLEQLLSELPPRETARPERPERPER